MSLFDLALGYSDPRLGYYPTDAGRLASSGSPQACQDQLQDFERQFAQRVSDSALRNRAIGLISGVLENKEAIRKTSFYGSDTVLDSLKSHIKSWHGT